MVNRDRKEEPSTSPTHVEASLARRSVATHMRIQNARFGVARCQCGGDGCAFGVFLENFFVANFCDSESAKRVSARVRSSRAMKEICGRRSCCIQEMPVPQGFLACLTRHCWCFSCAQHGEDSTSAVHLFDRAAHLRRRTHQHFLKWHSGFFISLVYSNCSASRIAGCTTLTSHLINGGQHG